MPPKEWPMLLVNPIAARYVTKWATKIRIITPEYKLNLANNPKTSQIW